MNPPGVYGRLGTLRPDIVRLYRHGASLGKICVLGYRGQSLRIHESLGKLFVCC